MYYEYRVRWLDNVEYRGTSDEDGIIQAEDIWQAFTKLCEKEGHRLYDNDGKWRGCDVNIEDEAKIMIIEDGCIHLHTGDDWDLDFNIEQVDKNEAYETVETINFKRHIYKFEIKLHIEKENPNVDIKCRLKIWVAQEGNTVDYVVDVDFENNKLLWPISKLEIDKGWEGSGKPIDADHEFDNIDEVFEHVRNYLGNL